MRLYARFFAVVLLLTSTALSAVDEGTVVFSTSPIYSRVETVKLFTPLMNYLSEMTGKKFEIDTAANFIEYSVRMRLNKYDMLFDEPHFVGWRLASQEHAPIARLPGEFKIVVIAKGDSDLGSMAELEGGFARVCAAPAPDMVTMAFLSYYPNPVRQPNLVRTQGLQELKECLDRGRGEAAVLSASDWEGISENEKTSLKVVAVPPHAYPERTFTVGPRIDDALREQIAQALLSEEGQKASQGIFERFNKKNLIAAKPDEYQGLEQLLSSMWGFH